MSFVMIMLNMAGWASMGATSMRKLLLTLEQRAELKNLEEKRIAANERARAAAGTSGLSSEAFLKADAEEAEIIRRIKEIRGTAGSHWMG
jgi:hypothetical protein